MTNLPPDADTTPTTIEFPDGLPGFPEARRFSLGALEEGLEPFCVLRSVDVQGLQFIVVPPGGIFANYVIDVPEDDVESLALETAEDALVLVIVTVAQPPTANLLGPVVINRHTGRARQVVLVGSGYEVRTPLPGA